MLPAQLLHAAPSGSCWGEGAVSSALVNGWSQQAQVGREGAVQAEGSAELEDGARKGPV